MRKKKRKHNPNLIRARHSYTFSEIAEVYEIHITTVRSWMKQGLNLIDGINKPYLVLGEDVKRFLKEKARKRKHPLKPGEFFCPRCRSPRKSLPSGLSVEITDRKLGKKYKQALIRGVCEICKGPLLLFSSDRKVKELQENGVLLAEHKTTLVGSEHSSVNTHIIRGENVKT